MSEVNVTTQTDMQLRREALQEFWYNFSRNRGAVIGFVVFVLVILIAVLAPLIAPYGFAEKFDAFQKVPPIWQEGGNWKFILGTDDIGRDMLSRLLYGARYSLLVGFVVALGAMVFGVVVGVVAGYFGGAIDSCVMRIMDIVLAFPSLFLALIVVNITGYGLQGAILATAIALQPHFVRLARATVMAEKNQEYVTAASLAGAGRIRQMFKTILPNCMAPLIVQGTFSFSNAILDVAALGFLGMGAQAPMPEWGTMLSDGRSYIESAWWLVTFPGICILVLVLAINLMGDGLRDAFDPKLKRS